MSSCENYKGDTNSSDGKKSFPQEMTLELKSEGCFYRLCITESLSSTPETAAAAAAKSLHSCRLCATPQTAAYQAPWDSPGKNTGVGCHFILQCVEVKSDSEVAQSCPTLRGPLDCSLPGFSVHGIFQAKVLEWFAIVFSTPETNTTLLIKEPACQCRRRKRQGFDPWVGKIPQTRAWQPLQYSCLENPVDRGAWQATVRRVIESRHN